MFAFKKQMILYNRCVPVSTVFFIFSSATDKAGQGDEEDEGTGALGAFQPHKSAGCVVTPQVFQEKSGGAVEHGVEEEHPAFGRFCAAVDEQHCEDEDVYLSFPDFRRPEGGGAIGGAGQGSGGVENAEAAAGGGPEGIPVQQVGHASHGLTEYHGGADDVPEFQAADMVFFAIDDSGNGAEEDAPLDGHAPLPDVEDFRQVVGVVAPVEEEYIPKAAADDARSPAIDADVKYMLVPASVLFGQKIGHTGGQADG